MSKPFNLDFLLRYRIESLRGIYPIFGAVILHWFSWLYLPRQDSLPYVIPSSYLMMAYIALGQHTLKMHVALFCALITLCNLLFIPDHPAPLAESATIACQLMLADRFFKIKILSLHPNSLTVTGWTGTIALLLITNNIFSATVFSAFQHSGTMHFIDYYKQWALRDTLSAVLFFTYFIFFVYAYSKNQKIIRHSWRELIIICIASLSISYVVLDQLENPFVVIAIPTTLIALRFRVIETGLTVFTILLLVWIASYCNLLTLATDIFNTPTTGVLTLCAALIFPQIACIAMNEVRNRQEDIVKLSERINLATQSNGIGIWEWDNQHHKMIWDKQMYRLYGLVHDQEYLKSKDWRQLVASKDLEKVDNAISVALSGAQPPPVDFNITTPDGSEKIIRSSATPIKDANGNVIRLIGINADITDAHYAELLLEKKTRIAKLAQDEFAQLFELAPGPLLLTNDKSEIYKANSAAHKLFNVKKGDLIHKSLTALFEHHSLLEILSFPGETTILTLNRYDPETQSTAKKNKSIEVEIQRQNIKHNDELLHIVAMRDLTEQKDAERAISSARKEAEMANQAKSEFIANMSHEIRTPLNATLGTVKLLQNTQLTDLQLNYLRMIKNSGESLLAILNDILDISKIEAGRMELSPTQFNLEDTLNRIGSIMSINAGEKDVDLIIHINEDVPLELYGDPLRLQQILVNLVSNAIKFTERGYISVRVGTISSDHNHLVLGFQVKDTGIGISEAKQKRLFSAFMQADNSITRKYGGSGLGLLISKRLVEMMGGSISLLSKEGAGSTFSFSISLLEYEQSHTNHQLQQFHKVMVIEPSDVRADSFSAAFKRLGFPYERYSNFNDSVTKLVAAGSAVPCDTILISEKLGSSINLELHNRLLGLGLREHINLVIVGHNHSRERFNDQIKRKIIDGVLIQPATPSNIEHVIDESSARKNGLDIPSRSETIDQTRYLENLRLLLVEDNAMNQVVARGLLEQYGAEVDIANDGKLAIERLKQFPSKYHTILMDIQMPEMDGFTATKIIRDELKLSTPILAMTAGVMESEKNRCTEVGMEGFISKPIDVEEMLNAILKANNRAQIAAAFQSQFEQGNRIFSPDNLLKFVKGNNQRYNSIVQMIANVVNRGKAPLEQGLTAYQEHRINDARRLFHTLKGSMGNIGAMEVWESAQRLESALINHLTDEAVQPLFADINEKLDTMLAAARVWLSEHQHLTQASENTFTEESFKVELEHLKQLLSENNMQAFDIYDELKSHLFKKLQTDRQTTLETQIQNLRFGDALKLICEHIG